MTRSRSLWPLLTIPPILASAAILAIGAVSHRTWLMHLAAVTLTFVVAMMGRYLPRWAGQSSSATAILALTVAGVAAPLLHDSIGPTRWIALGPLNLYTAPLLLPAFLAACSSCARQQGHRATLAVVASLGVSMLLAMQPDASQVLALLAGMAVVLVQRGVPAQKSVVTLLSMIAITAWAFSRPDPLEPVPYVEGVFALALGHSLLAGLAVMGSALLLVAGLCLFSFRGPAWLSAIAAYYTVLFACSVAGLTPAPLIGYGAGPLLGFGLLVAVSGWMESAMSPRGAIKPAPGRAPA